MITAPMAKFGATTAPRPLARHSAANSLRNASPWPVVAVTSEGPPPSGPPATTGVPPPREGGRRPPGHIKPAPKTTTLIFSVVPPDKPPQAKALGHAPA